MFEYIRNMLAGMDSDEERLDWLAAPRQFITLDSIIAEAARQAKHNLLDFTVKNKLHTPNTRAKFALSWLRNNCKD